MDGPLVYLLSTNGLSLIHISLGFEEESYLDLFQAVMELDKKYRVPVLLLSLIHI